MRAPAVQRWSVRVTGIVQGVGFRPFVHRLAAEFGLSGSVGNDERGVLIEAEGPPGALVGLVRALRERPPPLAAVSGVETAVMAPRGGSGFTIVPSTGVAAPAATLVSPDTATCDDCLAELFDPADRRYRHPFVNCTNCGPRFTIVTGVPYDRAMTTMAGFAMCAACAAEYHDPADRRFHAQPVCCPDCGPTLRFVDAASLPGVPVAGHDPFGVARGPATHRAGLPWTGIADGRYGGAGDVPDDPVAAAADALRAGAVVAVKGVGGYHLAARARDGAAVAALRARKHREDRSFAVMVPDLARARELCRVDEVEAAQLTSHRAPIVLLARRPGDGLAPAVAPGDTHLGLMLPYTPVHHLLLHDLAEPIVLTSGNVSDEPIAHRDDDAATRLAPIADALLTHDRPIRTRADDSVLRVVRGRPYPVRRSRGWVPEPIVLCAASAVPVLGCGAELKNTFCVLRGAEAFVSHHIGDLANAETMAAWTDGIAQLCRILDVEPGVVAHDLHPDHLSTRWALDRDGVELVGVQHHHAHLAGCLAEHGEAGPVIGIACDGTGYGTDGTLWGGEVFDVSVAGFTRVAHLEPVPLPGGETAIREPWRTAASWLRTAGVAPPPGLPDRVGPMWNDVQRLLAAHEAGRMRQPVTSSAGRLFDAVSALCGVRDRVTYEGQAAIELERVADLSVRDCYRVGEPGPGSRPPAEGPARLAAGELIRAVVADLVADVPVPVVAARFHHGLAGLLADAAVVAARAYGRDTVALSGGAFANQLLLELLRSRLEAGGLRVLVHSRVPCNDGGISLGQVAVAAARA
ncbi:carbamoyltransferase HypF [Pseudonocardia nematodicida]|uniref:Carbamoyltransferase n=1 Tax=Pseudonocardia nematodicida TaxID=1206997 RepID=A0ABV1K6F6_9PSEU